MSRFPEDGGPAFPVRKGDHAWCVEKEACRLSEGLTLRDWFAGEALKGFCASDQYSARPTDELADYAYTQADAMIVRRAKS